MAQTYARKRRTLHHTYTKVHTKYTAQNIYDTPYTTHIIYAAHIHNTLNTYDIFSTHTQNT